MNKLTQTMLGVLLCVAMVVALMPATVAAAGEPVRSEPPPTPEPPIIIPPPPPERPPLPPPEREIDEARGAGQAWVDKIADIDPELSQWQGAGLTSPQAFHNPKSEVIAYMFAIERNGKKVGRVLVGSSAYGYSILEASEGPPLSIPPRHEVASILGREHGLQIAEARIGEPMLLLLNILRGFYAVWEVEGQVAGINLVSHESFVAPWLEEIRSSMPSPEEYKAAKRATSQSLPLAKLRSQPAGWGQGWWWIPSPGQMCAKWLNPWRDTVDFYCGPASATTIGIWQRDVDGDGGFPARALEMFNGFKSHIWMIGRATLASGWRRGFREYGQSLNPEEHFTFEIRRPGTYWQIVSDIHNGWPLGLMGEMDTWHEGRWKLKPHWVAVKGYYWMIGGGRTLPPLTCGLYPPGRGQVALLECP
ncbi:hypothetical protein M1N82_02030 [Dehalococcoidia bacterium]|nr:hypothetical protein [Dehalococcoidia bacterium]MCL0084305.1 hypothetical protein [Dehalococcoidia bacterium]